MGKSQALLNRGRRSAHGCATCKIRKVKCDETKPNCQRCLSTGRICDGYPSQESQLQRFQPRPSMLLVVPITQQFHNEIDHRAFCTFAAFAPTLANFASTEIWNTYALQISYAEPAIRHIVLSVGHLLNTSTTDAGGGGTTVPDHHHQTALYHYGKALNALVNNPSLDVNVVLLSCLMFCLFEELQGNCYASLQHVIAGKKILLRHLRSLRTTAVCSSNLNSIKASSAWDPLLVHLLRLFSRLETHTPVLERSAVDANMRLPLSGFPQTELMTTRRLLNWDPRAQLAGTSNESPPLTRTVNEHLLEFDSITDASQYLASLATACSQYTTGDLLGKAIPRWHSTFVISSRETVMLNNWLEAFNRLMAKLSRSAITLGDLANCHILRTYHGCLVLMDRAKHMGRELILDDNLVFFDITMFRLTILISVTKVELIAPLFFVATRCRVAYTRLRAIDFLSQCGWEGQFLADIAEYIMNTEDSNAKKRGSSTDAPIPEESRLRLHGIDHVRDPRAGQDNIVYLIVSKFPYHPRAPTMLLPIRLPWAQKNIFKARSCLDHVLRFEMFPSVP